MLRIIRDIYLPGYVVSDAFSKAHIVKRSRYDLSNNMMEFEPVLILQANRYGGHHISDLLVEYRVRATALKIAEYVDFAIKDQPMPAVAEWEAEVYSAEMPPELTVTTWNTNELRTALKMVERGETPSYVVEPIRLEHQTSSYSGSEQFFFTYGERDTDCIIVSKNRYDGRVEFEESSYRNTYRTLDQERRRLFAFQAAMGAMYQLRHLDRHSRSYAHAC